MIKMAGHNAIAVASICILVLLSSVVIGGVSADNDVHESHSMHTVRVLCSVAMFKDECINTLGKFAHSEHFSPGDYVKAGLKLALDEVVKSLHLADTLLPKAEHSKQPERVKMAIDDCKDLLDYATQRLSAVFNQVGDPHIYKEETKSWSLRLWLSDIITYQTSCVDGFVEAQDPELHSVMRHGTVNATELTMSILDIVTYLSKSINELGSNLNPSKLVENLHANFFGGSGRILADDDWDDGTWMERHLLGVENPAPNAVVDGNGSGQFRKISDALKAYDPKVHKGPYIIHVKAGIYKEEVLVDKKMVNVFMYGDGPTKTVVTGNKSYKGGYQTSKTATFAVQGDGFLCKNMGFQNTAGPEGHQAVALRVNAQQAVFHNCRFDGYQDTLYTQGGSHFIRDSTISGTVDFIFGNGATLIQNCMIIVRLPEANQFNAVTAQGRLGKSEPTAIVIQNCQIVPERALVPQRFKIKTFLGRPWKPYARTVFMESVLGDLIQPQGYEPWGGTMHTDTAFYGEYANRGPGAKTNLRVKWKNVKVLSTAEAEEYTAEVFLKGMLPALKATGVPLQLALSKP